MCLNGSFFVPSFEGKITGEGFGVAAGEDNCVGKNGEEYLLSDSLLEGVSKGAGIGSGLSTLLQSLAIQLGDADLNFEEIGLELVSLMVQLGEADLAFRATGLAFFCEVKTETESCFSCSPFAKRPLLEKRWRGEGMDSDIPAPSLGCHLGDGDRVVEE
jgi:hypothetical protein